MNNKPPDVTNSFKREGLTARGFSGFITFSGIDLDQLPTKPGVYVVLREKPARPCFLVENPAGWFKGKDPTVPLEDLERAWPDGSNCVYIGKAAAGTTGRRHLRQRIKELRQFGDGRPVDHQGENGSGNSQTPTTSCLLGCSPGRKSRRTSRPSSSGRLSQSMASDRSATERTVVNR